MTSIKTYGEVSSPFPTLIVCNIDEFSNDVAFEIRDRFSMNQSLNPSTNAIDNIFLNYMTRQTIMSNKTLSNILIESYRSRTIISCVFNLKECKSSDFKWIYDRTHGVCFEFETTERQTQPGDNFGLRLQMFIGVESIKSKYTSSRGLNFNVYNRSYKSKVNSMMKLSPGSETSMQLATMFNKKLDKPHNDCIKPKAASDLNNIFSKQFLLENKAYTQE